GRSSRVVAWVSIGATAGVGRRPSRHRRRGRKRSRWWWYTPAKPPFFCGRNLPPIRDKTRAVRTTVVVLRLAPELGAVDRRAPGSGRTVVLSAAVTVGALRRFVSVRCVSRTLCRTQRHREYMINGSTSKVFRSCSVVARRGTTRNRLAESASVHQRDLLSQSDRAALERHEVDSRGDGDAAVVAAVPRHCMSARAPEPARQRRDVP